MLLKLLTIKTHSNNLSHTIIEFISYDIDEKIKLFVMSKEYDLQFRY